MTITEATKANLRRKSGFVDDVQKIDGIPLFSWIDINITELCNRTCVFCPRVDEDLYPNQNLNMPTNLTDKIASELTELNYKGAIILSGFGEPTLHPNIRGIVSSLSGSYRLEIVTNGDKLTAASIKNLTGSGINYYVVSMYDGPHQREHFQSMFREAGLNEADFILRDRWHDGVDDFGLKLTNRAGVIHTGQQPEIDATHPCYYPAYSMMIDWNGDILLCVQDWNKRVKAGNIYMDSLLNIWRSPILSRYRRRLIGANRDLPPCKDCNADGTLHGHKHKDHWLATYPGKLAASR